MGLKHDPQWRTLLQISHKVTDALKSGYFAACDYEKVEGEEQGFITIKEYGVEGIFSHEKGIPLSFLKEENIPRLSRRVIEVLKSLKPEWFK